MPYVRFGAGLAPTSDEAVTRSDDQSGVAVVDEVPQGYEEIDAATYATDKATILAFNTTYEPIPPQPDPAGLRQAVLGTFGRQAVNVVFSKYPTAVIALEQGDYDTLRATVDDMLDLMAAHDIPGGV